MIKTMLQDGRRVRAETCLSYDDAAYDSDLMELMIECQCCHGSGEHLWSPSGYGVDPDGGHYTCEPCDGYGECKIE